MITNLGHVFCLSAQSTDDLDDLSSEPDLLCSYWDGVCLQEGFYVLKALSGDRQMGHFPLHLCVCVCAYMCMWNKC